MDLLPGQQRMPRSKLRHTTITSSAVVGSRHTIHQLHLRMNNINNMHLDRSSLTTLQPERITLGKTAKTINVSSELKDINIASMMLQALEPPGSHSYKCES